MIASVIFFVFFTPPPPLPLALRLLSTHLHLHLPQLRSLLCVEFIPGVFLLRNLKEIKIVALFFFLFFVAFLHCGYLLQVSCGILVSIGTRGERETVLAL
jgi:hypothetical protein